MMKSEGAKTPIVSTNTALPTIFIDKSIFYPSSFISVILRQFFSISFYVTILIFFTTFLTPVSKSKWIGGIFIKICMWF